MIAHPISSIFSKFHPFSSFFKYKMIQKSAVRRPVPQHCHISGAPPAGSVSEPVSLPCEDLIFWCGSKPSRPPQNGWWHDVQFDLVYEIWPIVVGPLVPILTQTKVVTVKKKTAIGKIYGDASKPNCN